MTLRYGRLTVLASISGVLDVSPRGLEPIYLFPVFIRTGPPYTPSSDAEPEYISRTMVLDYEGGAAGMMLQ